MIDKCVKFRVFWDELWVWIGEGFFGFGEVVCKFVEVGFEIIFLVLGLGYFVGFV